MKEHRALEASLGHNGSAGQSEVHSERYRVFVEDVADGFYETDLRGNFTYFNNALCRLFGYSRAYIKGRNFREFMDRENARSAFNRFNGIYLTGQGITDIVWEIKRQDGEKRVIELSANLILDSQGQQAGFRGIARDVTEKHAAQCKILESEQLAQCQFEASRRAERRYRSFLKFLPDPVFVFNLDSTVSYLNPAFEKVFGWTLEELKGKRIPFVPDSHKEQTREGVARLLNDKVLYNFETKRLTRDGRLLDIVIDGAMFYDEDNRAAGQVVLLRDVSREKRADRINQAMFRITQALYQFRGLDARLDIITNEVKELIPAEGALVILIDPLKKEFFFRAAAYDDSETARRYRETRFPLDSGVAGQVIRTGQPQIVNDYYNSPYMVTQVDENTGIKTRNMLQVPIRIDDRMIGVLCGVNRKEGAFDQPDVDLLNAIAGIVALPIENARINEELQRSYEEVQSLNRAKDQVIHRLSHELKTPLSVLKASLELLVRKTAQPEEPTFRRIIERSHRNLQRLLEMQYEIEDIVKEQHQSAYHFLLLLLDGCADELEVLVEGTTDDEKIIDRVRRRIDELFGPRDAVPEDIVLKEFVDIAIDELRPRFNHRKCSLVTRIDPTATIRIPPEVLSKIIEGLVRNAVENTPDGGRIEVKTFDTQSGPVFEVIDTGVGITAENQRLIFENYFTAADSLQYSTRKPYDFNAGGRGFDLLRMKIFSERYRFTIRMDSNRCRYIPGNTDICSGDIDRCQFIDGGAECLQSGGTRVRVLFRPSAETDG